MRALEPEVFDAVWGAVRALLPAASRFHPLGCHRPRICDEVCFRGLMIRLVTGCGCRKLCRGWSGGISVLVDESATAGRFHDLEVSIWLVCSVGGDGWSLIE